jgi:hypothetical protein
MKSPQHDHTPIVQAWLKEPAWLPQSDLGRTMQIVHQTPQQRSWLRPLMTGRSRTMFSATKVVLAGVIVASLGGFVYTGVTNRQDQALPGAGVMSPSPSATLASPSASPLAPAVESSTQAPPSGDAAIVFGAGSGQALGGWQEIGRSSGVMEDGRVFGEFRDLHALGDRLVAVSTMTEYDEGPSHDVIIYSTDGTSWFTATVPGTDPDIAGLAATSTGLTAAGDDAVDGKRAARIWTTTDGVTWTEAPAPDVKRIDTLVSGEAPVLVISGNKMYVSRDGAEWELLSKTFMPALRGPGGFLEWQGGGQDRNLPTVVLHRSEDLSLSEVPVADALGGSTSLDNGIQIFALPDRWVLVASESKTPDTIYTSANGLDWQEAPRPEGMAQGEIRWVAEVGDEVQAFGTVVGEDGARGGLWGWQLGEAAGEPELLDASDEFIDAPVAWQGGHVATGLDMGRRSHLTLWRFEPAGS